MDLSHQSNVTAFQHSLGLSSLSWQEAIIFWFHGSSYHPQSFWSPRRGNLPPFCHYFHLFHLPCNNGAGGLPWWLNQRICLQWGRAGFNPWVRKITWGRAWQPTPVFLPGESPWTEAPGGLQSMESQRVGHNWVTKHKGARCMISVFFKYLVLSQLFHSPLSLSSRGSLVPLLFLSLAWCYLHYLRLLIFLPPILIPVCNSSSPAFPMMCPAYRLNKQGDSR